MKISRRFVLLAAACAATAGLPFRPGRAWAITTLTMGDFQIDSLSDGHLELPVAPLLERVPEAERADLLKLADLPADGVMRSPLNVTLLRTPDRTILFDVGSGTDFVPTAGRLAEALAALNVAPEDVTDVVFTHAHPDHLWGLLDEFDEPLFASATLHMGADEFAYWTDPATVDSIGEAWQSFAVGASRRLEAVADTINRFADGAEVLPGVRAVMTPGHTPGHMSFAVGTPDKGIFITGDFVTSPLGFLRPDVGTATDSDPELAAATRKATLARLADDGWTVLGYHLPDGGIGRVEREGETFRFVAGN